MSAAAASLPSCTSCLWGLTGAARKGLPAGGHLGRQSDLLALMTTTCLRLAGVQAGPGGWQDRPYHQTRTETAAGTERPQATSIALPAAR